MAKGNGGDSMFWPVVAMLEFAALIVLGVIQPGSLGWDATSLGAAATFMAAAVALWLGLREQHWRAENAKKEIERTKLYALTVLGELASASLELAQVFNSVGAWKGDKSIVGEGAIHRIDIVLGSLRKLELDRLSVLDVKSARELAKSIDSLMDARRNLSLIVDPSYQIRFPEICQEIQGSIDEALRSIGLSNNSFIDLVQPFDMDPQVSSR